MMLIIILIKLNQLVSYQSHVINLKLESVALKLRFWVHGVNML